jgi:hypothetical protein
MTGDRGRGADEGILAPVPRHYSKELGAVKFRFFVLFFFF